MVNLYEILGLKNSCTQDEIKKQYHKLARKYHPDKNQGKTFDENKFKEINAAYNILSNEQERKKYDLLTNDQNQFNINMITKFFNESGIFNENGFYFKAKGDIPVTI